MQKSFDLLGKNHNKEETFAWSEGFEALISLALCLFEALVELISSITRSISKEQVTSKVLWRAATTSNSNVWYLAVHCLIRDQIRPL